MLKYMLTLFNINVNEPFFILKKKTPVINLHKMLKLQNKRDKKQVQLYMKLSIRI